MFSDFIGFVKSVFQPFLQFFDFLPSPFKTTFYMAIALLVFLGCKRTVKQ